MAIMDGLVIGVMEEISHHIETLPTSEAALFGMASIILISAIGAFIARLLKQPLIPAYVIAGLLAGPLVLGLITSAEIIYAFLEIGIIFLLFTAGLEISLKKIKEVNLQKILLIGAIQVALIFGIMILSKGLFDLSTMQAVYFGVILAFSSTMVDIKLLSDKGELVTLHGRLVLGILLLQDIVAIIAIALLNNGTLSIDPVIETGIKLALITIFAVLLNKYVLKRLFHYAAHSTELLFISSLGVLFTFIIISYASGISIAIGAFIAGLSLANSPFKTELESRISPIKDFFAILFFVSLGMQIVFTGLHEHFWLLIFLIIGASIIKPIMLFILFRLGHYQNRTSFHAATTLGQLSEFSLIIGLLGINTKLLTESMFSTLVLATVITMSVTPYVINHKEKLFKKLKPFTNLLKFLPENEVSKNTNTGKKSVLLVGAHRIGSTLLKELSKDKEKLLVIDYNPEITKALSKKKISNIYGDIMSPDVFNSIRFNHIKLAISTLPGFEENKRFLEIMKHENRHANIIVTAQRISEAKELYSLGADYVIMPKVLAGKELVNMITKGTKSRLKRAKEDHKKYLRDIHKILY